MILTLLAMGKLTIFSRLLIVLIVSGFMPLTAITFFWFMMDKKEKEYTKATKEMGIMTSRKVRDTYAGHKFFLPVSFAFLICFLAILYFSFAGEFAGRLEDSVLLTGAFFGEMNKDLIEQSLSVLTFAFLGGFVWSAQNIIRRLIAYDLAPSVYYSAGVRIILASVVAVVLSFLIGQESGSDVIGLKSSLPAIAFLTGMFPERVLQYLVKLYKKYVGGDNISTRELSLYKIEGISMSHKERLEEVGIDNAQNLATASLTQMLIETPFSARQLLDWIGQAKLLCYVKDDIDKLRAVGIRSVFDFFKGEKSAEDLTQITQSIGINNFLLLNISEQILNDEGIKQLFAFQKKLNSPDLSEGER